jgi:hypothetical protein
MSKNQDDYKDLCGSIVEIMKLLQNDIARHGATAASRLEQLCGKLERYGIWRIFLNDSTHCAQFATRNSPGAWAHTEAAERPPWPS